MANRIIKESIRTSDSIDQLSWFEECMFYRLIVTCDDYGCMDARPKILASALFPLKDIRVKTIEDALRKFSTLELVTLYEVDGKPFLRLKTWDRHQRVRDSKHKYPTPDEETANGGEPPQSAATRGDSRQLAANGGEPPQSAARARAESLSLSVSQSIVTGGGSACARARESGVSDLQRYIGEPTPAQWEELRSFLDVLGENGDELLSWAVKEACDHGARNWAYVRKVLNNLAIRGIKTVEQAEANREQKTEDHAKPTQPRKVTAQQYSQRDYSGEPEINDLVDWMKEESEKQEAGTA